MQGFKLNSWLATIGLVSTTPVFLYINYLILKYFNVEESCEWSYSRNIFTFFGAICQQGSEHQPRLQSTRMIFFSMLLGSVYILQTFSASYTSFLSVVTEHKPFETFEDLYKNTNFKIGAISGGAEKEIFTVYKEIFRI